MPPTRYRRWPAAAKRSASGRTSSSTGATLGDTARVGGPADPSEPERRRDSERAASPAWCRAMRKSSGWPARQGVLEADQPVAEELEEGLVERLHAVVVALGHHPLERGTRLGSAMQSTTFGVAVKDLDGQDAALPSARSRRRWQTMPRR